MNVLRKGWQTWREDHLLRNILRNTGYLFSSNTISLVLSLVQSIFAARLLGVNDFGVVGIIIVFASTLNRLFSFRMGELVVKYLGQYQAQDQMERAGALVKVAFLVEGASSILAFVLLVILSPWAAVVFAKDASTAPLFVFFGVSILSSLFTEAAVGVLQIDNKFRSQALINLFQSILTAGIILAAYFANSGIWLVLTAYLAGKLLLNLGTVMLAWHSLAHLLPGDWWRSPLSTLPPRKELVQFTISTNLSATLNLLVRDSEVLWVALFLSPVESGYFRVALAIINLAMIPINPLINTTFPEISRAVAAANWARLKALLKRITLISGGWTILTFIGILIFGNWLLLFYGEEFLPAFPLLLILMAGYGFANTLFWNRPLLLAFGQPMFPFTASAITGLFKVILAFVLVPALGYLVEGILLSGYFFLSVSIITGRGLSLVKRSTESRGSEA
jgi:O-antigen/teichoic acid export membrane protein